MPPGGRVSNPHQWFQTPAEELGSVCNSGSMISPTRVAINCFAEICKSTTAGFKKPTETCGVSHQSQMAASPRESPRVPQARPELPAYCSESWRQLRLDMEYGQTVGIVWMVYTLWFLKPTDNNIQSWPGAMPSRWPVASGEGRYKLAVGWLRSNASLCLSC